MSAGVRQACSSPMSGALALIVAIGCAFTGSTTANDERSAASRGWKCALCPVAEGWKGTLDIGVGWVSDSSAKFGDYRGLNQQGGFAAVDGDSRYLGDGGRFIDFRASDLGIDRRSVAMRGGVRGRYVLEFDYREIPKYRGFGAQTVYQGAGGSRLVLPPDWQSAPTTDRMSRLADALVPADLEIRRKTARLGVRGWLGSGWSYDVGLEHQRKEGTRPFGAGVFTIHTSHLPAPVDFSINRFRAGLHYAADSFHWRLGLSASDFDNRQSSITWPNPFTPVPGTELLRASLEPDNHYRQVEFAGAWSASRQLRFSAAVAFGEMEQNEPLLPASINPNYSEVPIPRTTADTRIDLGTFNLAGNINLRLSPHLVMAARLRLDERENRTPVDLFDPIITDIAPRETRPNRPYSFERDRASLELRYRARHWVRLQAGLTREEFERSLQSVLETEGLAYWGEISMQPGSRFRARARLERSERDAGPYVQLADGGPVEHPLMRKFHLADRQRNRLQLDLDYFPLPELTVALSLSSSRDDYARSLIGLREADDRTLSLDLAWSATEHIRFHGFASRDEIESRMTSAESVDGIPWSGATRDRFLTFGAGIDFAPAARSRVGFDLVMAESRGDITTASGGLGGAFPTLGTELWNAQVYVEYGLSAHWAIRARLEYEAYDSSDWALDAIGPNGIPAVLAFGQHSPDYEVVVIRLQSSFRF